VALKSGASESRMSVLVPTWIQATSIWHMYLRLFYSSVFCKSCVPNKSQYYFLPLLVSTKLNTKDIHF
jgi:hypothetical protein